MTDGGYDAFDDPHAFGAFTGMYCEVRHPATFSALCLLNMGSAEGGGDTPPDLGRIFVERGRDREFLLEVLRPQYVLGGDPGAHADAAALMGPRIHELYFAEWPGRVIITRHRDGDPQLQGSHFYHSGTYHAARITEY